MSLFLDGPTGRLGVSTTEAHLLAFLGSYGPCPIAELLRVLGLKKSTLTSLLDRLVERGLVSRESCPEDRRSFVIGLTHAGNATAGEVRRLLETLERRIAAKVSREDLAGFRAVMTAVAAVTDENVRAPDVPRTRKGRGGNK